MRIAKLSYGTQFSRNIEQIRVHNKLIYELDHLLICCGQISCSHRIRHFADLALDHLGFCNQSIRRPCTNCSSDVVV